MTNATGRQLAKEWFDCLETELTEQARRAGLLGHSTLTGDAREFFVRNVLAAFLPPSLLVETGRVIGADHKPSKQVDIVIFDSRFPVFRLPDGSGLFPVEGVVATLEVKSQLSKTSLDMALSNCFSVAQIGIGLVSDTWDPSVARIDPKTGLAEIVDKPLAQYISPNTYVFGFHGLESKAELNKALQSWLVEHPSATGGPRPFLPSVLVTGGAVAIEHGDAISVTGGRHVTDDGESLDELDREIYMYIFDAKRRFGWLASHLLHVLDKRRMYLESALPVRTTIAKYLPFEDYFREASDHRLLLCGTPRG